MSQTEPSPISDIVMIDTPQSSNLLRFGYSPSRSILIVVFKNGSEWHYSSVPLSVFDDMKRASSPAKFFHASVKNQYKGLQQ